MLILNIRILYYSAIPLSVSGPNAPLREACGHQVKKKKWARHVKAEKNKKGVEGGGGDGKVGGDMVEGKGGLN